MNLEERWDERSGAIVADLRVNIVEPTLEGEAGHCRSFVESRCQAPFR